LEEAIPVSTSNVGVPVVSASAHKKRIESQKAFSEAVIVVSSIINKRKS